MDALSIKRIGLILKTDWYEFKEYAYWGIVSIPAGLLAAMFMLEVGMSDRSMMQLFFYIMIATFILGMSYVNFRSNTTRGLGLLMPATPLEKFISLLIALSAILLFSFAVYFLTGGIFSLIQTGEIQSDIAYALIEVFGNVLMVWPQICAMALFWLCMVAFRRKAILKTLLIVAGIVILFIWTSGRDFPDYLLEANVAWELGDHVFSRNIENVYPGILILLKYSYILYSSAVVVMFYIGYLKLKEKEQR